MIQIESLGSPEPESPFVDEVEVVADNPFDFVVPSAPESQDPFDFDQIPGSIDPLNQPIAEQSPQAGSNDDLFFQDVKPVKSSPNTVPSKPTSEQSSDGEDEAFNKNFTIWLSIAGVVFLMLGVLGASVASTGKKDPKSLKEKFVRKVTSKNNVKKPEEEENLIDWKEYDKKGIRCKMPLGPSLVDFPNSVMWWGVRCRITRVVIFIVVSETDLGENPSKEECAKLCSELLHGEVIIKESFERNGYKGYKGLMGPTGFLPMTKIEIIPHAGRFVVNGYSLESMREAKTPKLRALNVVAQFYNSLEIDEYESGWFGF